MTMHRQPEDSMQVSDMVMVRVPARPVRSQSDADRVLASSDPFELTAYLRSTYSDTYFRAAIAHAAPPLWAYVSKLMAGGITPNTAKLRRAAISSAKFLNRMTTRPTPFGLFAAVTETSCTPRGGLAAPEFFTASADIRPDFRWLLALIRRLEKEPTVLDRQVIYLNELIRIDDNQVVLYKPSTDRDKQSRTSIKRSGPISVVIEACKGAGCAATTLYRELAITTGSSDDSARRFVQSLLELGLIHTGLRPKLTGEDPLDELIGKLESSGQSPSELKEIQDYLRLLAERSFEDESGFVALVDALMRMERLHKSTDYLHITSVSGLRFQLPDSILADAESTLRLLQRLSQPRRGMRGIRAYHSAFLERYGIDQVVPLRTATDPNKGIGVPQDYSWPEQGLGVEAEYEDVKSERREGRLARMYSDAIRTNAQVVDLTEEDVAELAFADFGEEEAQDSAELYFSVTAPDFDHLKRGDYGLTLGPNPGSHVGLSTAGRFLPHLPNLRRTAAPSVLDNEVEYSAVLSYAPRADTAANVGNASTNGEKVISVNTPHQSGEQYVDLDHVGLSATMAGLFAVDLRDGRRIHIRSHNTLYPPAQAPNEIRLLADLMHEHQRLWEPWSWGQLEYVPFTPAVRFGRVTLVSATWSLNEMRQAALWKSETPYEDFAAWRESRQIPRYCLASSSDMRLMIDTQNPGHIELLRHELRRDTGLMLQGLPGGAATPEEAWGWLNHDGHAYANEIVVTFTRTRPTPAVAMATRQAKKSAPAIRRMAESGPRLLPGGEWLSARLYLPPEETPTVLRSHIAPLFRRIASDSPGSSPFFLRYSDATGAHLRIRVHRELVNSDEVGAASMETMRELCATGAARTFVLDEYAPESHRYGGEQLVPALHAAFSEDSLSALSEIELPHSAQNLFHDDYILRSWLDTLIGFGPVLAPDQSDPLAIAYAGSSKLQLPRSTDPSYTKNRERWKQPILSQLRKRDGLGQESVPNGFVNPAVNRFGCALQRAMRDGTSTSSPERIVGSLMHMTFNRVNGPDPDNEKRLLSVLQSVLMLLTEARRSRTEH